MERPLPETNWTCCELKDAEVIHPGEDSTCEFCGRCIRWIHLLRHAEYHRPVRAGCCCALRYCFGYDAKAAERACKNRLERLKTFVNPKQWKKSGRNPNNICRDVRMPDGKVVKVTVFLKEGQYRVCFAGPKKDDLHWHPGRYATPEEAKNVAFELIDSR